MRIKAKADYVRSDMQVPGGHLCHWPGCKTQVKPSVWGCRAHWYKLPMGLRNKIWHAFRPGQERDKKPSRRYVEVAREVQDWIYEQFDKSHDWFVPKFVGYECCRDCGIVRREDRHNKECHGVVKVGLRFD